MMCFRFHATQTVAGLRDALVGFGERLAAWALAEWTTDPRPSFVAPVHRWTLPDSPSLRFRGIAPGGSSKIVGAVGGVNEEHIRLAERLRRHRAGLSN